MNIKNSGAVVMVCSFVFTLSGCTGTMPDAQPEPTIPAASPLVTPTTTQSAVARESFYSAARPCVPQHDDTYLPTDLQTLLGEAERVFNAKPLAEILSQSGGEQPLPSVLLPGDPPVAIFYLSTAEVGQAPVMVAQFGYGANVIDAFSILRYENGAWKAQPYPQASPEIAQQRNQVLSQGKFCGGLVVELHQRGNLLAVVNDLGRRGTRMAQEVHLLEREGDTWRVAWVPTYETWQTLRNARVEFQGGIDSFIVHHRDNDNPEHQWQEVWKLQGTQYVKVETMP